MADDAKWFLVKTKPLNEPRVHARLTGAGYEALFPRILKKNRRTGAVVSRPLFPTYLFVRFLFDQLHTVRFTRGVARVISFGPDPQEVPADIVEATRTRMDENGIVTLVKAPANWKRGQKIRIGEGPFAGLEAIFVEELPDRDRVVLLLEAMSSIRLTIDSDAIER